MKETLRTQNIMVDEIFRIIMENSWDLVYLWDIDQEKFVYFSPAVKDIYGYTQEEVLAMNWKDLFTPECLPAYREFALNQLALARAGFTPTRAERKVEYQGLRKDGSVVELEMNFSILADKEGRYTYFIGISRDITARKQAEKDLEQAYTSLLRTVDDQTKELRELNTALKVLLERRDTLMERYKEDMRASIRDMVLPLIDKLKQGGLDKRQQALVERMEVGLRDVVSPMARKLSSGFLSLSPTGLQIASLIKEGKTTDEIADVMHLSPKTIEFHREKIREKLGLKNKKVNLRSYLMNLE